jgi:hypothetical protein
MEINNYSQNSKDLKVKIVNTTNEEMSLGPDEISKLVHQARTVAAHETKLGVNREINIVYTWLPDNEAGDLAAKLVDSINATILKPSVLPDNEAQRAWILSRQRFWSARGLMLAFRLFGVIPDPTQRGGIIYEDFRPEDIAELKLMTDIDYAIYQLLVVGDTLIQNLAASEGQDYPFDSPLDLFIEILRTAIHRGLTEDSPWDPEPAWRIPVIPESPHKKTKDPGPEKIIRNMYRRFIKFLQGGFDGEPEEKTFVEAARKMGWSGYWILALRSHKHIRPVKKPWKDYISILREAGSVYLSQANVRWINGKPFLMRRNKRVPIELYIDAWGRVVCTTQE